MIYEYPEEFVVPVTYVNDLKDNSMHRNRRLKYLQVGNILLPYEEAQINEKNFMNENLNFLNFDEEILKEDSLYEDNLFQNNVIEQSTQYEENVNVFKDIDNEYANNETLKM